MMLRIVVKCGKYQLEVDHVKTDICICLVTCHCHQGTQTLVALQFYDY